MSLLRFIWDIFERRMAENARGDERRGEGDTITTLDSQVLKFFNSVEDKNTENINQLKLFERLKY